MQIVSIANGYATLRRTREGEENIVAGQNGVMIAPNDFAQAAMQLNRMIENGMPIENFVGLLCSDPNTGDRKIYLLINDGKSDVACIEVAA